MTLANGYGQVPPRSCSLALGRVSSVSASRPQILAISDSMGCVMLLFPVSAGGLKSKPVPTRNSIRAAFETEKTKRKPVCQVCHQMCWNTSHAGKPHVQFERRTEASVQTRLVLRKKSVRDEFVNKNLRETLDCSTSTLVACSQFHENSAFPGTLGFYTSRSFPGPSAVPTVGDAFERCPQSGKYFPP